MRNGTGVGAVLLALAAVPLATEAVQQTPQLAKATFAAGCFWCMEPPFDELPGVVSTTSGYTGGRLENPTYEQVSSGGTGHTEALEIVYDPAKISYEKLLEVFWRNVDAVDGGGQFCDRGEQYRPGIFAHSDEQKRLAEASKQRVAAQLKQPIAVMVEPAGTFWKAEEYHQDYYKKNPVRYKFYSWNCGRAQRLEKLWGKALTQGSADFRVPSFGSEQLWGKALTQGSADFRVSSFGSEQLWGKALTQGSADFRVSSFGSEQLWGKALTQGSAES